MSLQAKCFAELDELSKLTTLSGDGAEAQQEHLVSALTTLYRDEIKREGATARMLFQEWRKARSRIRD